MPRAKTAEHTKQRFHHGNLREALVAAARDLLIEHGPDGFTLADACRRAGVTTAAPYKHFRSKQEVLQEIVSRGFNELAAVTARAVAEAGPGTIAGMTAMVISYLDFAVAQPAVFSLMFGHKSDLKKSESGSLCLKHLINEVSVWGREHGQKADAELVAIRLWTFVHGASCLELDGDYERVAPGFDVRDLIADVTPGLLSATPS
jgi:AcrR family transcriptional regulator